MNSTYGGYPLAAKRKATKATLTSIVAFVFLVIAGQAAAAELAGIQRYTMNSPYYSASRPKWQLPALRDRVDAKLQRQLSRVITDPGMKKAIRENRFSAALVDITDPHRPRMASINGDAMVYAASLPKIAILLAAFEQMDAGLMAKSKENIQALTDMIRWSSNSAATAMYEAVGPARIAAILQSDRYGLYDKLHNGGLWVGRPYAKKQVYKRDPLHGISHGATAIQVARFYYLLENGRLVSPESSQQMKEILGNPGIHHKFVKGLENSRPGSTIFRKSGSWRSYHTDSAIVERNGRRYIVVMLANDVRGGQWLSQLVVKFDDLVHRSGKPQKYAANKHQAVHGAVGDSG